MDMDHCQLSVGCRMSRCHTGRMCRLDFPFTVIFLLICCVYIGAVSCSQQRNVLLIIADDAGFEMGVYRNKVCQTPNIDKLAKDSLIFNNAFTSASSCSPSRSAILTGQPSHQNGMYGLHHGIHHFNSFNDVNSVTEILHSNGIKTGIIGKKHVGPASSYPFDFSETEENNPINQVGRNITHMKLLTKQFLSQANNESKSFFLYIGFHDPHRCGHTNPEYGAFCERWGTGQQGMGHIPDWNPWYYQWDQVEVPYYVPDTEAARRDIAAQYTTMSRLDQGIGLILKELELSGHKDDTLIIFTSDNGIPFPSGRTNLYDGGVREPLLISSPVHKERKYQVTNVMTSLLDIVPTLLDWFSIKENDAISLMKNKTNLTGKTLLPLLIKEPPSDPEAAIFTSQTHHEVTMYYPMRSIRTNRYKLIHNINYKMPFPIDQDFYVSATFQDILNRTQNKQPIPWYKSLKQYYYRPRYELYDLKADPAETINLAWKTSMKEIFDKLKKRLLDWQQETRDPWMCAPDGVLEDSGIYRTNPQCMPLNNEL